MTEPLENQPKPQPPKEVIYKKIALMVLIILICSFLIYAIMNSKTVKTPESPISFQDTYTKTIKVKALSPTGSDMGLGIFATDEKGYLAYLNDANVTTGEKNIVINGTYDITYYYEEKTQFRIITHIEQNTTGIQIPVGTKEAENNVNISANSTV